MFIEEIDYQHAQELFEQAKQLERSSLWPEAFNAYRIAASAAGECAAQQLEALARAYQARICRNQGDIGKALFFSNLANRTLAASRNTWGKEYVRAHLELVWGTVCNKLPLAADQKEATAHFDRAMASFQTAYDALINARDIQDVLFDYYPIANIDEIQQELLHGLLVVKINLAEILVHDKEQWDKAETLGQEIYQTGLQRDDPQIIGGGARILGELYHYRHELEKALAWSLLAQDAYKKSSLPGSEAMAAVENLILKTKLEYGQKKWEEMGYPDLYPQSEMVPEAVVLADHPYLKDVDLRAKEMPATQAYEQYLIAFHRWNDAGWYARSWQYLAKAEKRLDILRASIPLKGSFPGERRAEYYGSRAQEILESMIVGLLMARDQALEGFQAPKEDAFYYREKLGALSFLDEMAASQSLHQLVASYIGQTGNLDRLKTAQAEVLAAVEQQPGGEKPTGWRGSRESLEEEALRAVDDLFEDDLELRDMATGQVASVPEIRAVLPAGTVLVEFAFTEGVLAAFVIHPAGLHVPIFESPNIFRHPSTLDLKQVKEQVIAFTQAVGYPSPQQSLEDVKSLAKGLYDLLMRPVIELLERQGTAIDRLVIVPQGLLHMMPFCALYDGERFLIERYSLIQAPSASVFRYCLLKRSQSSGRLTYFGLANPEEDNMPGFERVIEHAASCFGQKGGWSGDALGDPSQKVYAVRRAAATDEAFFENAPHFSCLDLETHGRFSAGDPLGQGVLVRSIDGSSHWMTAKDIFHQLRVQADLLVAALCDSGQVKLMSGDEMVGLVRAFLFAGCRSLLVYPWALLDEAAEQLLKVFYSGWVRPGLVSTPAMPKDKALQQAQLSLIAAGRTGAGPKAGNIATWEHPNCWSWTLIGDFE